MEEKMNIRPHKLTLENRGAGTVTGIREVVSFDENQVVLDTDLGLLTVKGKDLHVSRLTLEKGEVDVSGKIDSLTANLDKMYMDRLTGLLAEADFERIYQRVKIERNSLEDKLKELEAQKESPISTEDRARELVQQFLDSAYTSRELLVSLIERVELTEDKQIIIKFRFRELEAIS